MSRSSESLERALKFALEWHMSFSGDSPSKKDPAGAKHYKRVMDKLYAGQQSTYKRSWIGDIFLIKERMRKIKKIEAILN